MQNGKSEEEKVSSDEVVRWVSLFGFDYPMVRLREEDEDRLVAKCLPGWLTIEVDGENWYFEISTEDLHYEDNADSEKEMRKLLSDCFQSTFVDPLRDLGMKLPKKFPKRL